MEVSAAGVPSAGGLAVEQAATGELLSESQLSVPHGKETACEKFAKSGVVDGRTSVSKRF